jgi:uncharacterized membrane protein YebE (DUF533 family)
MCGRSLSRSSIPVGLLNLKQFTPSQLSRKEITMSYLGQTTAAVVAAVVADGVVDAAEVADLRAFFYEDGTVDADELNALFEINDAVSGNGNDAGWTALFVEAGTDAVLADDETPGVLDDAEWATLKALVDGDGTVDGNERALLANIKANATSTPADFDAFCAANGV